jgi:class 3 adenylate cyclase
MALVQVGNEAEKRNDVVGSSLINLTTSVVEGNPENRRLPNRLSSTSVIDLLHKKRTAGSTETEFFSNAFGQAHEQLDHFFENSMRDLRRREIEIEGTVLTSQRRLMAMSEEAFLAGEADQKRVDLLASQKKKSQLLLGHENEAKRQRQDAAAKTEALFLEASASKARSLKMQQLQETHELALALNRGAADRAPAFAREMAFLQRQQNDQREFIKETQSRRALNLELRQAAVRSTKKDVEARFLKREQDCEKQNLKEYGQREAEQLRSIQAIQLVQSQDIFDEREEQHRQTTQVQALHLTQKQELRAHHLEMKQTAKMSMLVKIFQVKEAERGRNSEIKTEKLLASQGIEAKQLLIAQQDARESRTAARTLDEKQTRDAIKQASDSVAAQFLSASSRKTSDVEGDRSFLAADNSSFSAQNLLALAREVAFALQLKQDFERKNEDAKQRDEENEIILKRKEEVASEIEREKTMVLTAKHQMEVDLAEMASQHAAEITALDVTFTLRLGKLVQSQNNELAFHQRFYASELEEIQTRAKFVMTELKASFPLERKYEQLLHQILPESIASSLAAGQNLIALKHTQVTVIFVDLVDFTAKANLMQPEDLVRMLNLIFGLLDDLCGELHLTKIKTIGDSYMCVANIPDRQSRAVECAADFALRVVQLFRTNSSLESMMIRVGMAFGDVIAGVIGTKKPSYDVWGPIVNLASRMEHNSLPGKILVTHELAQILESSYVLEQREKIEVKGCGMLTTYFLNNKRK